MHKNISLIFLFGVCMIIASFFASHAYATSHCPNYDPSKGDAQCYCYPVTVTAATNTSTCSNGKITNVHVTWDGANCVFVIYTVYYTDDGQPKTKRYDNGGSNYANNATDISGANITNVGVGPNDPGGGNSNQITYDTPNACPAAPTNTPIPPTATPTPSPTPSGPTATPTPIMTTADVTLHIGGIDINNINNVIPHPGKHGQSGWPFTIYAYQSSQDFTTTPYKIFTDTLIENTNDPSNPIYGVFQNPSFAMTGLPTGTYKFLVKTPMGSLRTHIGSGTFTITGGTNNTLVTIDPNNPTLQNIPLLIMGDITGDNQIDVQDYSILLDCYAKNSTSSACMSDRTALKTQHPHLPSDFLPGDLNDNGVVDGIDFNTMLRGPFGQIGAGGIQSQ